MNIPKTCVIGADGLVGHALFQRYSIEDSSVLGTTRRVQSSFQRLDLSSNPSIEELNLEGYQYAVIAAALPNILLCSTDPIHTYQVNVRGTLQLVEQLLDKKITPILFSSDYVFDGKEGSYDENAVPNPLNEYGRQKAELEYELAKNFERDYLLIRLSKVYGLKRGDGTLLDQIFDSFQKKKRMKVAFDQVFSPVAIHDVVEAVLALQKAGVRGIYHVCGNESFSRLEIAEKVCEAIQGDWSLVESISLKDLHEPFLRPKRTSMINEKLLKATGIQMQSLYTSIQQLAAEYLVENSWG